MEIRKLRFDVRSKLESGLVITDATQCALELVENALDAKCTAVAVRINLAEYRIEVVDNGKGISPDDLKFIGERFMTSKCRNLDDLNENIGTFGYRGQALASIIDVSSKLIIKTKSKLSSEMLVKVFMKGKCPSEYVDSKVKSGTGTTITVYDFMSTMPVRQKRIKEIFDLQEVKTQLEYLALIHNEVCFTLRDENKRKIIFHSDRKRNAGLSLSDLFGMGMGKFLLPIHFMENKLEIRGFLGLERHTENNLQFFYVNKRMVSKSIIYKFVNGLIDRYLSERRDGDLSDLKEINVDIGNGAHNVYLIELVCPYSEYETFRNLKKTTVDFKNWDRIFHCLKSAVKAVLKIERKNTNSVCIIQKNEREDCKNLLRKDHMQLGQLKCGIRGGSVKRNQCQIIRSHNKSFNSQVNIIQKNSLNDVNQQSKFNEMRANVIKKNELLRSSTFDNYEIHVKPDSNTKWKAEEFDVGRRMESFESNCLIEFAGWLKKKVERDKFLRKIYQEFMEERVTTCEKTMKESILGKRKRDIHNGRQQKKRRSEKRKFPNVAKEIERGKLSISQIIGHDELLKHVKKEAVEQLKTEGRSGGYESLQKKMTGKSMKNVKVGNEFIELSSYSSNSSFISRGVNGCVNSKNYFIQGESSNSLSSRNNQNSLNEECWDASMVNCPMNSNNKIESTYFKKKSEKDVFTPVNEIRKTSLSGSQKEIEEQTSIAAFKYDKAIQINFSAENYENNDHKTHLASNIAGEDEKRNSEFCSRPDSSMKATISDYPNTVVDIPKLSSCNSLNNVTASEDSKLTMADTLSLFEDEYFDISNCPTPFAYTNRYTFIPKGLSPSVLNRSCYKFGSRNEEIMGRVAEAHDAPREGSSCEFFIKSLLPDEVFEEFRVNMMKNMIYYEEELLKSYTTKSSLKINPLNNTFTIDKNILSNIKIIGQWDNKFIIGKSCAVFPDEKNFLFLFDQHAVDERIRLEKLIKDSRNTEGRFISVNCNPPILCKMEELPLKLLPSLETNLLNFGIKVSVVDSKHVLFHEIPSCFNEFNGDNVEILLKKTVNEVIEEFNETRGSAPGIPRIMVSIMRAKACKGAVKFNDILSSEEMTKMINDLVSCQFPFQCAHGRPSLVPLLDLQICNDQHQLQSGQMMNIRDEWR